MSTASFSACGCNIKRLNLNVEEFVPICGRVGTWVHSFDYLGKPPEQVAREQKAGN